MTTKLESIDAFNSISRYREEMEAASRVREYIHLDEDKLNLDITRLTPESSTNGNNPPEYSTNGNNVENIIASRKKLYRTLWKKFPSRGRF